MRGRIISKYFPDLDTKALKCISLQDLEMLLDSNPCFILLLFSFPLVSYHLYVFFLYSFATDSTAPYGCFLCLSQRVELCLVWKFSLKNKIKNDSVQPKSTPESAVWERASLNLRGQRCNPHPTPAMRACVQVN